MTKYKPSAAMILDEWMLGEREFLEYLVGRQTSFLDSISVDQNATFQSYANSIKAHLEPLPTSNIPFPEALWTGERKYPVSLMVSYKDFLDTLSDNQAGLMAKFIVPASEIPTDLAPFVSAMELQLEAGQPAMTGFPSEEQQTWFNQLCGLERELLEATLWDRINPTPSGLETRCRVLLKRSDIREQTIIDLKAGLDAAQKSLDEQKVAFGVTKRGVTYRSYNPRKWRVGYVPTVPEALHHIAYQAAAKMWQNLTSAQKRPFKALAFGQRLVEWARQPPPAPTTTAAALSNTLNKSYLRFLLEYYRWWEKSGQAMPYPIENIFRLFYPDRTFGAGLFMLIDCDAYTTPDLVEVADELGKVFKSATCPQLDKQTIYVLPYGLGCQHWGLYSSSQIANDIAKSRPPVVAHDFRLRDIPTQTFIRSQDPRAWTYTGTWPQITKYLGDFADVRILGWIPWTRAIDVEIWRGNTDKLIDVFWGRKWLGMLETKGQEEQPDLALARFIVHYKTYHEFWVEILWWYKVKPPEFIPLLTEPWSYEEPPSYELLFEEPWGAAFEFTLLFTEPWDTMPGGPIDLKIKFYEGWGYIPPPSMTKIWTEAWSS